MTGMTETRKKTLSETLEGAVPGEVWTVSQREDKAVLASEEEGRWYVSFVEIKDAPGGAFEVGTLHQEDYADALHAGMSFERLRRKLPKTGFAPPKDAGERRKLRAEWALAEKELLEAPDLSG